MIRDLVYFLGRGSTWEDNELRYSLRSACAHYPHGKVFVIGHCPTWLTNVIHVPAADRSELKVRNTLAKLQLAVEHPELSEAFVLMNDDFFFLSDQPADLPSHCLGTMQHQVSRGIPGAAEYRILFEQGLAMLRRHGHQEPLNFESHHPLPMDRTGVRSMLSTYGGTGSAYAFRSIYGNHVGVQALHVPCDVKIRGTFSIPRGSFLSVDDACGQDALFRAWCKARWASPSGYEKA